MLCFKLIIPIFQCELVCWLVCRWWSCKTFGRLRLVWRSEPNVLIPWLWSRWGRRTVGRNLHGFTQRTTVLGFLTSFSSGGWDCKLCQGMGRHHPNPHWKARLWRLCSGRFVWTPPWKLQQWYHKLYHNHKEPKSYWPYQHDKWPYIRWDNR